MVVKEKKRVKVNIVDEINPNFYNFWHDNHDYKVLSGGRSSLKSSVISLKLVLRFLSNPNGNTVCLRKVANTLRTSVYEQIKWAIYKLGVENEFHFGVSPLKITHKRTNTAFYFFGVDDPLKLKGAKIAKGYVMDLWFEELAEFSGVQDIDVVEDTFIREATEGNVKVFYAFNPPQNPKHWVNVWRENKSKDSAYFLHHSTYLDDSKGFISKQMIKKIEKYKVNDYEYYRYMYLGEAVGIGNNVYNSELFQKIKKLPDGVKLTGLYYSIDTGHQVSATTALCMGLDNKGNVYVLDTYYYSPANKANKKAPSDLAADVNSFIKKTASLYKGVPIRMRTIDSAEGGLRNQYKKDFGQRLHGVNKAMKKKDMIDLVIDLLAQGRVFVLQIEANKVFISEHEGYVYDKKQVERNPDNPAVIKVDDHTCDAFQYFCIDNKKVLKLIA